MKYLLIAMVLTMAVSAEVQVGFGTQLVQEIGTDAYFPLIGQVKLTVPVMENVTIEARVLGETFRAGNPDRQYRYSSLGGIGYRMDDILTMSFGGGIHYFGEEYIPRAYYSLGFELNYLQRVEFITTFDLNGDPRPVGCGVIVSVGI